MPRQTGNIDAGMNQNSAQPCLKALWISELWQGTPRSEQGLLDGILTERSVMQDQRRSGIEAVDRCRRKLLKRALITIPSLLDEIHPHSRTASRAEADGTDDSFKNPLAMHGVAFRRFATGRDVAAVLSG
jgi:hypothetical protein